MDHWLTHLLTHSLTHCLTHCLTPNKKDKKEKNICAFLTVAFRAGE